LLSERRLHYVAMTRARDRLALLVPRRFYVMQQRAFGDRHLYASVSGFIPPVVASLFERVGPVSPAPRQSARTPGRCCSTWSRGCARAGRE
jgi:superfamily I DNA/RNA helicase